VQNHWVRYREALCYGLTKPAILSSHGSIIFAFKLDVTLALTLLSVVSFSSLLIDSIEK